MITTPNQPRRAAARGPKLSATWLPAFQATDLDSVRHAFRGAGVCQMWQAWLPNESPHFAPCVVRVGWRNNLVFVYAELTDADIHSRATGPNQRLWELGDAFEIFLRPDGQQAYVEFQVAPNNQRLQLRYASSAALERARQSGDFSEALLSRPSFVSKVWVEDGLSRWNVLAEIPAAVVCGSRDSLAGQQWRFSFSRYDYTRGQPEPVISSTSPHGEANFHQQADWGTIRFVRDAARVGG